VKANIPYGSILSQLRQRQLQEYQIAEERKKKKAAFTNSLVQLGGMALGAGLVPLTGGASALALGPMMTGAGIGSTVGGLAGNMMTGTPTNMGQATSSLMSVGRLAAGMGSDSEDAVLPSDPNAAVPFSPNSDASVVFPGAGYSSQGAAVDAWTARNNAPKTPQWPGQTTTPSDIATNIHNQAVMNDEQLYNPPGTVQTKSWDETDSSGLVRGMKTVDDGMGNLDTTVKYVEDGVTTTNKFNKPPPTAPLNPQDRVIGQVYNNGKGLKMRWTAQGWAAL